MDQQPPQRYQRRSNMMEMENGGMQAAPGQIQRRGNMATSMVTNQAEMQQQEQQAPPRSRFQRRGSMTTSMVSNNTEIEQQQQEQRQQQQQQEQEAQEPEGQFERRGSMTENEEKERRASIKCIMADKTLTPIERRRSIQFLMDGRRNSMDQKRKSATGGTDVVPVVANPMEMQFANMTKQMEQARPKCNHYDRNCTIIAPCCGAAFGCRICHDECPVLPPPKYGVQNATTTQSSSSSSRRHPRSSSLPASWTEMPEPESHQIDRFAIREIICRICFTRQSSKTNECKVCGVQFGKYHCEICNLWMSDEDHPYHCKDCGFCRVGGRENFRHCFTCGMCIDINAFNDHNCKVGKYMSNCPVCQEDLFSSRSASHEMPCGHSIHWHCFQELANHDSRCPICKKTAESADRMASTWAAIARDIDMQPLPPEWAKVVNITCNDCEERDFGRRWHFLGVQCNRCSSFNTAVDKITMVGQEAAEFLEAVDTYRRMHTEQSGQR